MLPLTQARQRSPSLSPSDRHLLQLLSGLSDPTRFKLFKLLLAYDDMCVTDLANACSISPPAASQQLKLMELSGLIGGTRRGQIACYHINNSNPYVKRLSKFIS